MRLPGLGRFVFYATFSGMDQIDAFDGQFQLLAKCLLQLMPVEGAAGQTNVLGIEIRGQRFIEAGQGYQGKRLYLRKVSEEKETDRLYALRRRTTRPRGGYGIGPCSRCSTPPV